MSNYPDDWNTYYYDCGCHAAWGCDCDEDNPENSNRPWLENSEYTFSFQDNQWEKLVSYRKHKCRKDHKDGSVKKGQRYTIQTWRYIDDTTGESRHVTIKQVQ